MIYKEDIDLIKDAKKNFLAREKLFHEYRQKIRLIAMDICKRPLDWNNDDELSISLIAFNEAIDTYDESKQMKFINYARLVIRNRLIDYFRKESKYQYESLDEVDDEQINRYEKDQSCYEYKEKKDSQNKMEMIEQFNNILLEFDISTDELVKISPKHRDTRETLMRVAQYLVSDSTLLSKFYNNKRLPMKELMLLTGVGKKVLERGRKYIITLTLILTKDELSNMKSFIKFPQEEGGEF